MKPCTQCTMLFIDNSNNQRRYCNDCATIRKKQSEKLHTLKLKERRGLPDPNKIQCLICYKWYKKPMSHAWQVHHTTAKEYKDNYNLEQKGLIPEHDKEILRKHVKDNFDLVVKYNLLKKGKQTRFKKDHTFNYIRKPATLERLKQHAKTTLQNNHAKNFSTNK